MAPRLTTLEQMEGKTIKEIKVPAPGVDLRCSRLFMWFTDGTEVELICQEEGAFGSVSPIKVNLK